MGGRACAWVKERVHRVRSRAGAVCAPHLKGTPCAPAPSNPCTPRSQQWRGARVRSPAGRLAPNSACVNPLRAQPQSAYPTHTKGRTLWCSSASSLNLRLQNMLINQKHDHSSPHSLQLKELIKRAHPHTQHNPTWMMEGYSELKSSRMVILSYSPFLGSSTRPPAYWGPLALPAAAAAAAPFLPLPALPVRR